MFENLKSSPMAFKVLIASALIENIAFGLIIPYLTLYMVTELEISKPLAGIALAGYTLSGIPGTIVGGILTDRIGRRVVLLSSLGLMSLTMTMYFFAFDFYSLLIIILADSFVGSLYMPAASAMIADVIEPIGRPKAYSMIRIAWNTGMVVGPGIGVFIVLTVDIQVLFLFGAAILAGAFALNFAYIPETRPSVTSGDVSFRNVMRVGHDRPFLMLCVLTGTLWFVMSQWMSALQLYAIEDLSLETTVPGMLFVLNGAMVVTLQLWVTSIMENLRRSLVMMSGQLVCAAGYSMIFLVGDLVGLVACVVVITVGEIIYMSILSATIADMSPEAERGVYMGFAGFVQNIAIGVGFFVGMWMLDTLPDTRYIWLIFGAFAALTSLGYIVFRRMVGPETDRPPKKAKASPAP